MFDIQLTQPNELPQLSFNFEKPTWKKRIAIPPSEFLHELFEHRNNDLIWKVKRARNVKVGDVAGCLRKDGYVVVSVGGWLYKAHRIIWVMHHGAIPDGLGVDHINNIKNDNRIENLRLSTKSQNQGNTKKHTTNTSGYKGVCWHKKDKKWLAQIQHNGKNKYLGNFDNPEDAHAAYVAAAKKIFGDFANDGNGCLLLKNIVTTNRSQ
jgi:hypothetical protein